MFGFFFVVSLFFYKGMGLCLYSSHAFEMFGQITYLSTNCFRCDGIYSVLLNGTHCTPGQGCLSKQSQETAITSLYSLIHLY